MRGAAPRGPGKPGARSVKNEMARVAKHMDLMRLKMRAPRPPIRRKQLSARNKYALFKHEFSTGARRTKGK